MRLHVVRSVARVWEGDHGLSLFLVILLLTVFVVPAVVPAGSTAALVFDVFYSLLVITGVMGVSSDRRIRRVLTAAVVLSLGVRWLGWIIPSRPLDMLSAGSWVVTTGLLAGVVLMRVFRAGTVNAHRILGAIAAYILFALTWAGAYATVAYCYPGAFRGVAEGHRVEAELLYYSLVTLTTVGYGDITPFHRAARALAMLEALVGQLYPAILIARLVTLTGQTVGGGPSGSGSQPPSGAR
jgi:hypothetical protein